MKELIISNEPKLIINNNNSNNEKKFIPYPILDTKNSNKIYKLLKNCIDYKIVKKGTNEVLNFINKDRIEIVIMSSEADPIELLSNFPKILNKKNIPFCFVKSSLDLGKASGIKRKTICSAILKTDNNNILSQISEAKDLLFEIVN